jgi:hypothetical protein
MSDEKGNSPSNVVPLRARADEGLTDEELADAERMRLLVNRLLKEATPKDGSARELSLSVLALEFATAAVLCSLDYSKEDAMAAFERAWEFAERNPR